jgi:demethylspheroidene O-methyltransferase
VERFFFGKKNQKIFDNLAKRRNRCDPKSIEVFASFYKKKRLTWRNDILADARFQRFAVRFPPTRRIANKQAAALFDLCAGFVYSQILLACVQLRLFDLLAAGPRDVADLATACELPEAAMLRLLRGAAALRLLEAQGDQFALGMLGAALRGNPEALAMIAHHPMFYADLKDPLALLRGEAATELSRFWPYAEGTGTPEGEQVRGYSALMAASQPMVAAEMFQAYDFTEHRCLLDLGGGDGSFIAALAPRAPRLALRLFDLEPVAGLAHDRFKAAGLGERATAYGGDFRVGPLPLGADIITLIRVLHDHDDAQALAILRTARAALPPDGTLLVAEPMADAKGAAAMGDAYFGFYLLAMGRGQPRRQAELAALLRQAGFTGIKTLPTSRPLLTGIMLANTSRQL